MKTWRLTRSRAVRYSGVMQDLENTVTIRRAELGEQPAALELVLHDLPVTQRAEQAAKLIKEADDGPLLDGLLVAVRRDRLTGAAWARLQPGRTAYVWPPRLAASEPETTADGLLRAVIGFCAISDVRLAQCLVHVRDSAAEQRMLRSGFKRLTELAYLVSPIKPSAQAQLAAGFELEAYGAANHNRMLAVLERTYDQTADCVELNGVRDSEDILAGYRATGSFNEKHWLLARAEGRDVGCLLLAEHPAEKIMELVYMGLVPDVRGRGWGLKLVQTAQHLARIAECTQIVLAVDARNERALRMYEAAAFVDWDRRSVLVKTFDE